MSLVTCVSSVYPPLTAPSLTLQPPCSALASHLGCADSGCGAAGALGAALQEAALCPEGTWEGGGGGGPWVGNLVAANSILLPRAWSCASMLRAVGCPWRPSTALPSWYGAGGGWAGCPLGVLWGGVTSRLQTLMVTPHPPPSHWRAAWPSAPPPAASSSRSTSATGSRSRWESGWDPQPFPTQPAHGLPSPCPVSSGVLSSTGVCGTWEDAPRPP